MTQSPTVAEAIDLFFHYRGTQKLAKNTVKAYHQDFAGILEALDEIGEVNGDVEELTVDKLTGQLLRNAFSAFAEGGKKPEGRSKATIERAHSSWRSFFDFLVIDGYVAGSPMALVLRPHVPERQPMPLRDWDDPSMITDMLRKLRAGCRRNRTPWPELDVAVFATLLATGTRQEEFLSLNIGSFEGLYGEQVVRVLGKGDKWRSIPVESSLDDLLAPYLESRRARYPLWEPKPKDPLWVGIEREPKGKEGGLRMTHNQLYYLVSTGLRDSGNSNRRMPGTMAHAFRHTYGTTLASANVPINSIKNLMGHASINTSQGYIQSLARDEREGASKNPVYGAIGAVLQEDG